MITKKQRDCLVDRTIEYFDKAGIVISPEEKQNIEIADFGLNDTEHCALQLISYINTNRVCAKEMVLLPRQTCPEHLHPPFGDYLGKEETFRCRYGKVYLYVEGTPTEKLSGVIPACGSQYYTVFHEVVLNPGDQYTIQPSTKHWFQAADCGAVISEFSTTSYDENDVFTNPNITRIPEIA